MKTFKDIKCGDYIYEIDFVGWLYKYVVTKVDIDGICISLSDEFASKFGKCSRTIMPPDNESMFHDLFETYFADVNVIINYNF